VRFVITGSSGHLGEALVRVLGSQGQDVVGVDVLASRSTNLVGSVCDRQVASAAVEGADVVIHAATLHKPHLATHDTQQFIETNVLGTATLLDSACDAGVGAPTRSRGACLPSNARNGPAFRDTSSAPQRRSPRPTSQNYGSTPRAWSVAIIPTIRTYTPPGAGECSPKLTASMSTHGPARPWDGTTVRLRLGFRAYPLRGRHPKCPGERDQDQRLAPGANRRLPHRCQMSMRISPPHPGALGRFKAR
jgi:hypothetical protein